MSTAGQFFSKTTKKGEFTKNQLNLNRHWFFKLRIDTPVDPPELDLSTGGAVKECGTMIPL
jgi:hypothetical protein